MGDTASSGDVESLTSLIIEGEEERRAAQLRSAAVDESVVTAMEAVSLKEAFAAGGKATLGVLLLLHIVEQFDRTALAVLAPDIQKALNISDTTLIGILSFAGVIIVLGAIPLAWLADRFRRTRIMNISVSTSALMIALTGLVPNPFLMFLARAGVGATYSYQLPCFNSLLADTYPIASRSRIYAIDGLGRPLGLLVGPLLAGALANWIGGDSAWRWVMVIIAMIFAFAAGLTFFVKEPPRGQFEQKMFAGTTYERPDDMRISMGAAFERLKKIRTFYYLCVGIGVLGFALVAVPVQFSLLLENAYEYGPFKRGWVTSLTWAPSLFVLPFIGTFFDKIFRQNPRKLMNITGMLVFGYGFFTLLALRFENPVLLVILLGCANALTSSAFACVGPIVSSVAPPQIRAQAFALVPIFIFLIGGFFGGLLAGSLSDSFGERTSLTVIAPPAGLLGGLIMMYGARFIRRDIAMAVLDVKREHAELMRLAAMDRDRTPLLQVSNVDVSYGTVQILFDVNFEVQRGEVLALLGTNGAGKSTLLRAISGLTQPDRGFIRLEGRAITFAEAEMRAREGVLQVRGGMGTFPSLTIEENLKASMMTFVDRGLQDDRIERVYSIFPILREKQDLEARSLSGGQQQMLALGMALVHDPKILLIDELSLGLAPIVVQELLEIVTNLKNAGLTMVIVEQSLNVALAFADRAVFLEKGHVRFEGPAKELAERGDLVRAVFLGADGG